MKKVSYKYIVYPSALAVGFCPTKCWSLAAAKHIKKWYEDYTGFEASISVL